MEEVEADDLFTGAHLLSRVGRRLRTELSARDHVTSVAT